MNDVMRDRRAKSLASRKLIHEGFLMGANAAFGLTEAMDASANVPTFCAYCGADLAKQDPQVHIRLCEKSPYVEIRRDRDKALAMLEDKNRAVKNLQIQLSNAQQVTEEERQRHAKKVRDLNTQLRTAKTDWGGMREARDQAVITANSLRRQVQDLEQKLREGGK